MRAVLRPRAAKAPASRLHCTATLVLDESGMICDCCTTAEELFGYRLRVLIKQHVSSLFPQLAGIDLLQDDQISPLLEDLCQGGHVFLAHSRKGNVFPCELSMVTVGEAGRRSVKLFVLPHDAAQPDLRA